MPSQQDLQLFESQGRIQVRRGGIAHRTDEYDERGFDIQVRNQKEHFWYRGRHRFLLAALRSQLGNFAVPSDLLSAVDLGAGCGGWINYLTRRSSLRFCELALADSSLRALQYASAVVESSIRLFQVDLFDLGWKERWDIVFMLDVLEHIPDQVSALRQVQGCLKKDGLLFLTVPALQLFWSYTDVSAHHLRRYSANDLLRLATQCGLKLIKARYFMFLLSPLLYLSRLLGPKEDDASYETLRQKAAEVHRMPPRPLNGFLRLIFSIETPAGLWLPFPWGTSLLGVFQKNTACW